jgi:hypothetical protein
MTVGRIPVIEGGIQPTIFDAKADLLTATANDTPARLAVGANNTTLVADSTATTGLKWVGFQGVSMTKNAVQSIPNATWTAITFQVEEFDTDAFHSTSSNTSRITIPTGLAGKYLLTGSVVWEVNTTGIRAIAIYKNGASVKDVFLNLPSTTFGTIQGFSIVVDASVSDYIELFTYQSCGTAMNIDQGTTQTAFQAQYLGA